MLLVLLLYLASTTMANPPSTSRRASSSSPSSWPHSSNYNLPITDTHNQTQFQFQTPQTTRLLSSAKTFLKKPHAIPALLSVFLLLTWVCLRLQYARDPKINVGTSRFSPGGDQDANVVRFHSSSSAIAKDKRGWLMDPVSVALEAGIPGGATSCASVHIGEIRPGSLRGNHRHHFCNETILIWGAKTLFRVENSLLDKGYGEVIINADEVAVATSPRGTAHALLNLDPSKTTYILGCQDNAINHNNSSSDFNVWNDIKN